MKILIPAVLAAACAQPVIACDLCAIYAASQAPGEIRRGPFAGVAVGNPGGQYLDSSISQVFAGYNFNERFGLQFNLPVIYRSFKRPDSMGGFERGTESGLGDVSLLGNFMPYQKLTENFTLSCTVLGGVKFPTGSSDRITEEFNEVEEPIGPPSGIHGHDLALGTGSFDGIVGAGIFSRWHKAFLGAAVQYAIRSEGDFHYQFANDLTWSGGPGYHLVLTHTYTVALQAVVSGEYKGKDTFRGQSAVDTGVTAVYLGPELSFTWKANLSARLAADLPVSIENTSLQTVPDYRIGAGLTWRF